MKAQSSIEYIILIGLLLVALIPLVYYATSKSANEIRLNQADQTVQTIAKAADNVYTAGPGNQEYIQFTLPTGVQNFIINDKDVIINLTIYGSVSNIHARSITSITNTTPLPTGTGTYNYIIKMTDKQVQIYQP